MEGGDGLLLTSDRCWETASRELREMRERSPVSRDVEPGKQMPIKGSCLGRDGLVEIGGSVRA